MYLLRRKFVEVKVFTFIFGQMVKLFKKTMIELFERNQPSKNQLPKSGAKEYSNFVLIWQIFPNSCHNDLMFPPNHILIYVPTKKDINLGTTGLRVPMSHLGEWWRLLRLPRATWQPNPNRRWNSHCTTVWSSGDQYGWGINFSMIFISFMSFCRTHRIVVWDAVFHRVEHELPLYHNHRP